MPKRETPLVDDHYYHIFNRGVDLRPIFSNSGVKDYERFIKLMNYYRFNNYPGSYSQFVKMPRAEREDILKTLEKENKAQVEIICFCLMSNHFHFLLKQKEDKGILNFLANLENSHTRYFNKKNERVGPLFQGRFKAVLVETEEQLLHLSRYIHLNPYSAAIVESLDELVSYPWSSLSEYLGGKQGFCQTDLVMSYFKTPQKYQEFIFDQADYQKQLEIIKHLAIQ